MQNLKMTKREKALLTILIAEIHGCQDMEGVKAITESWVKANDLHPEEVETLTEEQMQARFSQVRR